MFVIEDERHAEPQGKYVKLEDAVAELRRRSRIPWDEAPNRAPCMSSRTCGRVYELIEYDDTQTPWKVLRRVFALEISAAGVEWSREFEELTGDEAFSEPTRLEDASNIRLPGAQMKRRRHELPDCDNLFLRFFAPWYEQEELARRGFSATLPDMLENESFVGLSQTEASFVAEESQPEVLSQIEGMLEAAQGDWPTYLKVSGTVDLGWVDAFDRHYTRAKIRQTIERSDPSDFANDYIVICCECGAVLGQVLRSIQPRLIWRLDWPYWDSCLLDPKAGCTIAVFHWAIKKMSEYSVDDGLAAKVQACLQELASN